MKISNSVLKKLTCWDAQTWRLAVKLALTAANLLFFQADP